MTDQRDPEAGSAVVEYLAVALLLLLPLIYLVIALGRIQAASFAAEGAAREAGRIVAQADSAADSAGPAATAVEIAFADQGFDIEGTDSLVITCSADPCHTPGARIDVRVAAQVPLPFLPASFAGAATTINVSAGHLVLVEDHRGTG